MISLFWDELERLPGSPLRLLECGARRERPEPSGVLAEALVLRPDTAVVGLDVQEGPGVDVVADLHDLSGLDEASFDVVLILSVLEHLRRPWVAARELAEVTRPGGLLFCASHQTYPVHHYPGDYFRFSDDALCEVFSEEAGWQVVKAWMEFPCKIVPLENVVPHGKDWNFLADGMLGSCAVCRRL